MIDLHTHILPGLDDGAQNLDESVKMCRIAQLDGIHTLVLSPHYRKGIFHNDQNNILPAINVLKEALYKEQIPLKLLPGVDIHLHPDLITYLNNNPRLILGGCYVLLELPRQSIPLSLLNFLFRMRLSGYTSIITHPEQNSMIQGNPEILKELVNGGSLIQVTAMSLTGEFGEGAFESAKRLVKSGLVHSVSSDAHSTRRRPPILSRAKKVLEEIIGSERAHVIMDENPEKILHGEAVETVECLKKEDPSLQSSFIHRLFHRDR